MRLFRRFKSPQNENIEDTVQVPWHQLNKMEQLETIIEESGSKPVVIFKHSTRCGISRAVFRMFEKNYDFTDEQMRLYYLDLLQNREVSNEIANKFEVHHESPQLLVIKDGKAVFNTSHHSIEPNLLKKFL